MEQFLRISYKVIVHWFQFATDYKQRIEIQDQDERQRKLREPRRIVSTEKKGTTLLLACM